MNRSITSIALSLSLALSATLASAAADGTVMRNGNSIYGVPAQAAQGALLVDVNTATFINIECGDTVTFRNGDKSFSWKFDVVGHRSVDLQAIAPAGFSSKSVQVYVASNDSERN